MTEVRIVTSARGKTTKQPLTSDLAKGRMFAFGRDISAGGGRGMVETIRVLVIEQDSIHREGLVACLSQEPDIMVVGIGGDVAEALDTASSPIEPDVLIINLDQAITMRVWTLIGLALPSIAIIGLTEGNNNRILEIALAARVSALLRSNISPSELCDSLCTVIRVELTRLRGHPYAI